HNTHKNTLPPPNWNKTKPTRVSIKNNKSKTSTPSYFMKNTTNTPTKIQTAYPPKEQNHTKIDQINKKKNQILKNT
ncbi:hypothetical protein Q6268_28840, partial [Klebsiella pneumoniae]|uniref:hypothetical protein n=1 Tax=Klebsiella pneumoniae TaxID=573 RepID=UPI00273055BC